jgi:hypothetical protein
MLDKKPVTGYYQLQYFLDNYTYALNEEQKQVLLQDPSSRTWQQVKLRYSLTNNS